ncbi:MAG: crotonase/enoyl-CoA hydratase family protein [Bradyrhizobium sp.]|nr:crotonase/enoyl-CoA hydratase family protein [Bradyrhizobium sp.]
MTRQRVDVSVDADGVAEVVLARDERLNALDDAMFEALAAAIGRLQSDRIVRAVVLHGEGRGFCAGLDKSVFERILAQGTGAMGNLRERTHCDANLWQQVAWGWRKLPVPVIAAVHGIAFGGGLQIALGADIRYVHSEARLSVAEVKWGLVPDMSGCIALTELCRADVARELVFSGRVFSGEEAGELGLATHVSDDPLKHARAFARHVSTLSPDAVRAGRRLLNAAAPVDSRRVLMLESLEQQQVLGSPNQIEAIRAGTEKRSPRFC